MAINIDNIRICHKRSNTAGVEPTIPTVADHKTPGWLPTDLYDGELFMNTADHKVWYRTGSTITLVQGNASMVLSDLLDVGYTGSPGIYPNDGDMLVWDNDALTWINTPAGGMGVSGYSGYSGAAGATGTSGYSGTAVDGANSRRWYYGTRTTSTEFEMASVSSNFSTATDFYINNNDWLADVRSWHGAAGTWETANSGKLLLQVTQVDDNSIFGIYYIDAVKDNTSHWEYNVASVVSSNGVPTAGKLYTISWVLLGANGASGISGYSGSQGESGISGYSGSGISGYSGYSGLGLSGYSGYSGGSTSGYSGYSGAQGISGYSGVAGAGEYAISGVTSTPVTAADNTAYLINTAAASVTVNLPAAASSTGSYIAIKKIDATVNTVIIDGNGSDLVEGSLTYVLGAQYDFVTLLCTGTEWYIIG